MERRTISLGSGHKVRLELEAAYWTSLEDIARREGWTVVELIDFLRRRDSDASLARLCRTYAVGYYRDAAGDRGDLEAALRAAAED